MWRELFAFYWQRLRDWWLPDYCLDGRPESSHFHRRRHTREYRLKKRLVQRLWLGFALLILIAPTLPLLAGGGLFTTFVAFAILDESA